MKGRVFTITLLLLAFAAGSRAQSATATPSPDAVAVPVVAPAFESSDRNLPDLGRVGVNLADQKPLTLRDAIEMALDNNRDIEVTRKTQSIAEFDLNTARGFFQPRLTGQSYYERSRIPNTGIFSTNQTTSTSAIVGNAAVTGYYPDQGTVFQGTFNNTRLTTDNPISILSPQLNSSLGFNMTQPLFRGRKFDQPRRQIEIAKRNIELTDWQFRQRSIETVAGVERAYWDLMYALRNLQVQRDSLRGAKDQLEHNRRLVKEGQLAPIDIVAAETQVANYEQLVYDALNTANLTENVLKNLIAPNKDAAVWSQAVTPVEPVEVAVPRIALLDALTDAIAQRPELEINKTQKRINRIDQRFYREQNKPQIDLVASYNSSGIGGSLNPQFANPFARTACTNPATPECQAILAQQRSFLGQIGGSGTAFSDIFGNKYPVFRVGINFNIPLFGDKTAKAQLGRSIVEGERIDVQREQLEQGIQVEVRNALQSIRAAEARLRSAAIARENSAKQYESEKRKLDDGQSDVYRVLERQTALTVARSSELRARTELNKAIAELHRVTGNTLKANDITIR